MITMIALPYCASTCEFVHSASSPVAAIAVGDTSSPLLRVYDAHGGSPEPIQTLSDIHFDPVVIIKVCINYKSATGEVQPSKLTKLCPINYCETR